MDPELKSIPSLRPFNFICSTLQKKTAINSWHISIIYGVMQEYYRWDTCLCYFEAAILYSQECRSQGDSKFNDVKKKWLQIFTEKQEKKVIAVAGAWTPKLGHLTAAPAVRHLLYPQSCVQHLQCDHALALMQVSHTGTRDFQSFQHCRGLLLNILSVRKSFMVHSPIFCQWCSVFKGTQI